MNFKKKSLNNSLFYMSAQKNSKTSKDKFLKKTWKFKPKRGSKFLQTYQQQIPVSCKLIKNESKWSNQS